MKKLLLALAVFLPGIASAAQINDLGDIFSFVINFINTAIPTIIALAVLVFIWGVFRYVVSSDEEAKGKGKDLMIWGVVGLFVMISVWGLVNILSNTFELQNNSAPNNLDNLVPDAVNNTSN